MNDRGFRHRDQTPSTSTLASVWATGTSALGTQLTYRRYHPTTGTDQAVMTPAIAEHAITHLTKHGDIVLDPDCGAGTTIVEALRAGRHAIGLTTRHRWHVARTNVTTVKAHGAPGDGMVLLRRPGTLAAAQTAGLTGRVDLLLTAVRATALSRLRLTVHECRPLMRPGGHLVILCAQLRHHTGHHLVDLPSEILALGVSAGLAPVARCQALTADVRGSRVHTHATRLQRHATARMARVTGHVVALPAHHTVLVFRADPTAADPVLRQPIPPLPSLPLRRQNARAGLTSTERTPRTGNARIPVVDERVA